MFSLTGIKQHFSDQISLKQSDLQRHSNKHKSGEVFKLNTNSCVKGKEYFPGCGRYFFEKIQLCLLFMVGVDSGWIMPEKNLRFILAHLVYRP